MVYRREKQMKMDLERERGWCGFIRAASLSQRMTRLRAHGNVSKPVASYDPYASIPLTPFSLPPIPIRRKKENFRPGGGAREREQRAWPLPSVRLGPWSSRRPLILSPPPPASRPIDDWGAEAEDGRNEGKRRRGMSLVFAGVEVAGGTTVGLKDHVNLPMYLQQQQHGDDNSSGNKAVEEEEKEKGKERNGFYIEEKVKEESSETSSIGFQSSDSSSVKDGEEDEVQSKAKDGALGSLDSLEESLPIKRGLSIFFSGKSKSFASLADMAAAAATARDLAKPENPFNKRRRLLMASKTRRASYASLVTSVPPLHIAEEKEEEEEEGEQRNSTGETSTLAPLPPHGNKQRKIKKAFRSPRSFSLSDLQNV